MNLQLFRIDDRLIHGQVVIGWVNYLNTKSIILCDDSVSENEWEKELYLSAVPGTLNCKVLNVKDTAAYLKKNSGNLSDTILLVSGPVIVEQLLAEKIELKEINIGGIHFKDGRKKYLPYLYLNDEEVASFKRCLSSGVQFDCQDMPNSKKLPLKNILTTN